MFLFVFAELFDALLVGKTTDEQRIVALCHNETIQALHHDALFLCCMDDAIRGFIDIYIAADEGIAIDVTFGIVAK